MIEFAARGLGVSIDWGYPKVTDVAVSTDRQTAIRLLACIHAGGERSDASRFGDDVVCVLHAQLRLQALEFWMRNPDYLANELITEFECTGETELLTLARRIFDDREPDLRRLPMIRFLFGAYEPLDNGLAILVTAGFVRIRREGVPGKKVREHLYLLTEAGEEAVEKLSALAPELAWYRARAAIVARIAGQQGGMALKGRQYLQLEYAGTELNQAIAPITDRVVERLENILKGLEE